MASTDRFGGHAAWDAECDEEDGRRAEAARAMTCLDCGESVACAREGYGGVGWCAAAGDFVFAEDGTAADQGLECLVVA